MASRKGVLPSDRLTLPASAVALGCAYILAIIAFWAIVAVIALHFVAKFW